MTKIVIALTEGVDLEALTSNGLRDATARAGATRLQANLPDDAFAGALRLQELAKPVVATLALWCPDATAEAVLSAALDRVGADHAHAWSVEETVPLVAPHSGDGVRHPALANLAFLRRPESMPYDEWRGYWQGTHTQIAIDTQATTGYVQNRVLTALTGSAPPVAAIVEELFPEEAATDMHAFYGSGGDRDELHRRLDQMMSSVAKFGAAEHLDLVPTARYVWEFSAGA